jgi:hypothetical protein
MPRHLHVWLAEGLYNKVSVLIGLGDNTHCMPHDCAKAIVGLVDFGLLFWEGGKKVDL